MENKKALAVVEDLFFAAKIQAAAAQTGAKIKMARSLAQAIELARTEKPSLIIIDLNAINCRPLELLSQLKMDAELCKIPTLGFVAHVQTVLQEQARVAGCNQVMARSAFSRELASILS